jgi:hypothetical protein
MHDSLHLIEYMFLAHVRINQGVKLEGHLMKISEKLKSLIIL